MPVTGSCWNAQRSCVTEEMSSLSSIPPPRWNHCSSLISPCQSLPPIFAVRCREGETGRGRSWCEAADSHTGGIVQFTKITNFTILPTWPILPCHWFYQLYLATAVAYSSPKLLILPILPTLPILPCHCRRLQFTKCTNFTDFTNFTNYTLSLPSPTVHQNY